MSDSKDSKSNVLVLGGCGFIGRNFVKYLVDSKHSGLIRIADKSMPATSYLSAEHKAAFDASNVEYKQADLSREDHVAKIFKLDGDAKFDFVVNLCGETRCGLSEADYVKKTFETAVRASAGAAAHGVRKWVEISSAQVYDPTTSTPKAEDGKTKPWTLAATHRLMAEEAVKKNSGLPVVVLRPAIVYGPGDLTGITPRACCAAVYKSRNEKMKFLWDKGLKMNTVHVEDVAAAIWVAATEAQAGSTFNLADQSDLTQGALNGFLGEIFDIKTGFLGTALSSVAKMNLKSVAADANDKHVPGFTKLCTDSKILNTPVSAYIDAELLYANHTAVDGTRIASATSFRYRHPQATKDLIKAQIDGFVAQGLFPPITPPSS